MLKARTVLYARTSSTAVGQRFSTIDRRVIRMDFGKDQAYYDPNYADHPNHSHIICNDCDRIVEFEDDNIARLENEISRKLGFSVKTQRLQIQGACEQMKRTGACRNKRC